MLIHTGDRWIFESELALETVVANHLELLLSCQLRQRQYLCQGDICDLIAQDQQQRLVIIELKNIEDRYIVQQLSRYYDSLQQQQPWRDIIDYSKPVRLIAIAPSFHRHNFIDRKYTTLDIEFFTFEVTTEADSSFGLKLQSLDNATTSWIPLPFSAVQVPSIADLPPPPQRLVDALGSLPVEAQQQVFYLRQQILSFDTRIEEIVTPQTIGYGRGTKFWCAEFYFAKQQPTPILFLWLPLWRRRDRAIGRHRIWTDWTEVLFFAHVPTGLGQARPKVEWDQIPRQKWPRQYLESGKVNLIATLFHKNLATTIGCKNSSTSLAAVVEVALLQWQAKL